MYVRHFYRNQFSGGMNDSILFEIEESGLLTLFSAFIRTLPSLVFVSISYDIESEES